MPLYDWKCMTCGEQAEVLRPIADSGEPPIPSEAGTDCPTASGLHLWERRLSPVSVQRGPDWTGSKGNW